MEAPPMQVPPDVDATIGAAQSRDGTHIGYAAIGTGPAVVVCHGSFAAAKDWIPFATELAESHTVYLYDRRGRGASPAIHPDFAVDAEIDDLAAIMAVAGEGTALIGHSFGGGCALAFAARDSFPGPVIVYEPRHAIDGPVSGGHLPEIRRRAAAGDRAATLREILHQIIGLSESHVDALRVTPLWQRMLETVDAFPEEVRLLDTLNWRPGDLDGVVGQTWLLVGEVTPVLDSDREGSLRGVLPRIRKVALPGQGHFAYASAPSVLAQAVRDCLESSHPSSAPASAAEEREETR